MWSLLALISCLQPELAEEHPELDRSDAPEPENRDGAVQAPYWTPDRVVIIGAGPAGLAAAMDLPNAVVFEASERVGGRAPGSNQLLYFVGSVEQREMGIEDTPERAAEEWEDLTGAPPTQATWDYWAALPQVSERLNSLGLNFMLNPPTPWSDTRRLHGAMDPGLPATLQGAWPSSVELHLDTRVTGLRIQDGRVTGVEIGEDFIAAKAVVIASGGFANRVDLISDYVGWEDGAWRTDGSWSGDGDAIDWAEAYGLGLADMDAMGGYFNSVSLPGQGEAVQIAKQGPSPYIWVNSAGERFVEEEQDFSLYLANRVQEEPGPVWTLLTWEVLSERTETLDPSELASVQCAESWEDLAVQIGVDPVGLEQTLDVLKSRTRRFETSGTPCAFPPGITAAKGYGGLLVDDKQQVLDASGVPVKGLYAAGEASGMAVPGMGGLYGFDGSLSAVVWSGWRAAESINAAE